MLRSSPRRNAHQTTHPRQTAQLKVTAPQPTHRDHEDCSSFGTQREWMSHSGSSGFSCPLTQRVTIIAAISTCLETFPREEEDHQIFSKTLQSQNLVSFKQSSREKAWGTQGSRSTMSLLLLHFAVSRQPMPFWRAWESSQSRSRSSRVCMSG